MAERSLRADGAVLTAGLACLSDGTYMNPYEGLALPEPGYMGQARVVRRVSSIGPHVFAFRTSRLLDVNGLASVSEDSLGQLVRRSGSFRSCDGSSKCCILLMPSLRCEDAVRATVRVRAARRLPNVMVNPNLEAFPSVAAVLKGGIH